MSASRCDAGTLPRKARADKLISTAQGGMSQMQPHPPGAYYVPLSPRQKSEGLWEEKPVVRETAAIPCPLL